MERTQEHTKSRYKEFYHYAKGKYVKGNMIEDLKKLIMERCGLSSGAVRESDVIQILLSAVMETAKPDFLWMRTFIEDLDPKHWRYSYIPSPEPYDFNRSVISKLLSLLSITSVRKQVGREWVWTHDIGEPESKVLKLSKSYIKYRDIEKEKIKNEKDEKEQKEVL